MKCKAILVVLLLLAALWATGCATGSEPAREWGKAPEEGGLSGWPWSGGGPQ